MRFVRDRGFSRMMSKALRRPAKRFPRPSPSLGQDERRTSSSRPSGEYWTNRNRAARFQKGRQDALGLGWANHDHHTYRSSREHFPRLIAILEDLGFQCRERFYAGREAGWGCTGAGTGGKPGRDLRRR